MIQHLETDAFEELRAFIESHTDQQEIVKNVMRFTMVAVEGAIAEEVGQSGQVPTDSEGITTTFKLISGTYVWLGRTDQRAPGLRYEVHVKMPSDRKYDACCYLTQGGGGKLIDILMEDQITDWQMD